MAGALEPVDKLHHILAKQAAIQPEGVALWWQGEAITYAALNARVMAVAARLAGSGAPGERVAVLAWNCPQFIELIYAVPASGKILVPLNARLAPLELQYQLLHAGVTTLFAEPQLLEPLLPGQEFDRQLRIIDMQDGYEPWLGSGDKAPLPCTDAGDTAWILYTSGSTGRPKGAELSHSSFMAGLASAALGRPVKSDDRYLYPFPLFHVAAHNVLLQHQYGAAVVLLNTVRWGGCTSMPSSLSPKAPLASATIGE